MQVECSDGQIGFGRRRRSLPTLPADPNKIFEITITSFIKVNYDDESENFEAVIKNQNKIFEKGPISKLQTRNMQDRRFYETVQNQEQTENRPLLIQKEKEQYITVTDQMSSAAIGTLGNAFMVLICSFVFLLRVWKNVQLWQYRSNFARSWKFLRYCKCNDTLVYFTYGMNLQD